MTAMFRPIRCGSNKPTPYLRNNIDKLNIKKSAVIVDLGCGNCRNTNFLIDKGFKSIYPFDKAQDALNQIDLGKEHLPLEKNSCNLILCNYVLCFMNKTERKHLVREMKRVAKNNCYIVVEMFNAKNTMSYDIKEILQLFYRYEVLKCSKDRFIIQVEKYRT